MLTKIELPIRVSRRVSDEGEKIARVKEPVGGCVGRGLAPGAADSIATVFSKGGLPGPPLGADRDEDRGDAMRPEDDDGRPSARPPSLK